MQILPVPWRASHRGAVFIGIMLGAACLAISAGLAPVALDFPRIAEIVAVPLSGVLAGALVPMAGRVLLDGPSGVLVAGPIAGVAIGAGIASGSLVLPWSNPAMLVALLLSWIAVAWPVGRAVWMTSRPMPRPPQSYRWRDDDGSGGPRSNYPGPRGPTPGCQPCEDARNNQLSDRIAAEVIAKAMGKEVSAMR